jgi:hypothetical protein
MNIESRKQLIPTRDFGPQVQNPDAPKYLPVGEYIGWVRVNTVEVAKTERFRGKKYTLVRILCLQRVGTRKIWSKKRLFC